MKLKEALNTKNKIHDKINSIVDFNAVWEYNSQTKACRLVVEGIYMEKDKKEGGLTDLDKEWILSLIKPIQEDIHSLKKDVQVIKNCPTIKKKLK